MTHPALPTGLEVTAATERAARVVCSVADEDVEETKASLRGLTARELRALIIRLAMAVPDEVILSSDRQILPKHLQVDLALDYAAAAFHTTRKAILGRSRARADLDARAVVMAALRYVGHSASEVGRTLDRDHSTVLHACSRVGENRKLRTLARALADKIGTRGQLGDEEDAA